MASPGHPIPPLVSTIGVAGTHQDLSQSFSLLNPLHDSWHAPIEKTLNFSGQDRGEDLGWLQLDESQTVPNCRHLLFFFDISYARVGCDPQFCDLD